MAELDVEAAEVLGIEYTEGLVITGLDRGSSAQYSGLLPNDVLYSVNGKNVNTFEELDEALKYVKSGDNVPMTILRKGRKIDVSLKL